MKIQKATPPHADRIWEILQEAIEKRRSDGSSQWQNGYPNPDIIARDMSECVGYIVSFETQILGYLALIYSGEPTYTSIKGAWLNDDPYAVIHRLAITQQTPIKGIGSTVMKLVEDQVLEDGFSNIRIDTNFDNLAMLRILEKLNYRYCGEIQVRDGKRMAFHKELTKTSPLSG